jgi:hypothetical protein
LLGKAWCAVVGHRWRASKLLRTVVEKSTGLDLGFYLCTRCGEAGVE